jgi:F-type H+-transporting ATPase subunit epsilon
MATLSVEVVTGERVVYQRDDASMVVAPGAEGSLGILPRHAALVSLLKEGELRVKHGNEEDSLAVFGGFIEVLNNRVVVLADTAERTSDIDVERAEAARLRAEEALRNAKDKQDLAEAEAALRRAIVRLRLARGPRNYGMNRPPG